MKSTTPPGALRTLTELDHTRLTGLLRRNEVPEDLIEPLEELLGNVDLVAGDEIGGTIATMRSQLRIVDQTGTEQTLTLCYPAGADAAAGRISVLSAMGLAMLGRSAGQVARWLSPEGESMHAKLKSIAYQPEAEGDFQA